MQKVSKNRNSELEMGKKSEKRVREKRIEKTAFLKGGPLCTLMLWIRKSFLSFLVFEEIGCLKNDYNLL